MILWQGVLGLIAQSLHLISFLKLDCSKQLNKGFVIETTQNFGVISWNFYKLVILRVIIILFMMWLWKQRNLGMVSVFYLCLLDHVWPQTVMNIARHKTVNLLKALRAAFL